MEWILDSPKGKQRLSVHMLQYNKVHYIVTVHYPTFLVNLYVQQHEDVFKPPEVILWGGLKGRNEILEVVASNWMLARTRGGHNRLYIMS